MKIDPKEYRRRVAPDDAKSRVACMALAMEVIGLRDLADWQPVGSDLETLRLAMAGEDGLDRDTIHRLRRRAERWDMLHRDVRAFYVEHATARGPETCLRYVLGDLSGRPPGWALGMSRRLWEESTGERCTWDLCPTL